MQTRLLGRTELEVSAISLGCWALGGDSTWGEQDETLSLKTIHAALDVGINFFDTAEVYGNGRSEEVVGKALAGIRSNAIVATKAAASNLRPDDIKKACEGSLRRLQTDYIDLYYVHWPSREVPIEDTLGAIERLKQEGKIRYGACSNFGVEDLSSLLTKGRIEANQLAYNLLFRAIEHEIQQLCTDQDVGIVCYSPLAQGLLTGKFSTPNDVPEERARTRHFSSERKLARHGEKGAEEETFTAIRNIKNICDKYGIEIGTASLAWLLSQDGITSVIAGARSPLQVVENAQAGKVSIPDGLIRDLTDVTETLKQKMGSNPDMWQAESRMR